MKNILLALLMALTALPTLAQSSATVGNADFAVERARLAEERKAVEAKFESEKAACYKKFAVEGCLEESRRTRRVASEDIKRQEASMNDIERKQRGAAELERLDQKKASPRPEDTPPKQEEAQRSQQGREQRSIEHTASRAQTAAETAERQREFEHKQRANAEDRAKAARLAADVPAQRAAYEEKLRKAEEHRVERASENAKRTKPRAAPLPLTPVPSAPP
jgi:colicin import membrane protein